RRNVSSSNAPRSSSSVPMFNRRPSAGFVAAQSSRSSGSASAGADHSNQASRLFVPATPSARIRANTSPRIDADGGVPVTQSCGSPDGAAEVVGSSAAKASSSNCCASSSTRSSTVNPRPEPEDRATNSIPPPLRSRTASCPLAFRTVRTVDASSGYSRGLSKYDNSRRNAFRAVLTSCAVCKIRRPSRTILYSSTASKIAFLPFCRGTASPTRAAASLPPLVARPCRTTNACQSSRTRPCSSDRIAAPSPWPWLSDSGKCANLGRWQPSNEFFKAAALLLGSPAFRAVLQLLDLPQYVRHLPGQRRHVAGRLADVKLIRQDRSERLQRLQPGAGVSGSSHVVHRLLLRWYAVFTMRLRNSVACGISESWGDRSR